MARASQVTRDHVAIAEQYARAVVNGDIPNCKWVRLACQRHLADLERATSDESRYEFRADEGRRICLFAEQLPHIKGRWKSPTLVLEPWQCFLLVVLFGWYERETGLRRFRKALIVIPRKNGKSLIAAVIALFMLVMDGEPGAEVYSAATTKDQAKICWETGKKMVERLPDLRDALGVESLSNAVAVANTASTFKALSRDADTLEGLNPHCWITDELHAHKTREVFDVLDEATGARQQPLGVIISTEGDNPTGVFAEQVAYSEQILEGRHEDDTYFALRYTIDPEDDPASPEAWQKANPNLGVSVYRQDLEVRYKQAEKNPSSMASFLMKRLNVRGGAADAYFNMLAWQNLCLNASLKLEDFYGQPCYIGVDLASKSDLCAKVYMFPKNGKLHVFGRYYLPEDAAAHGNPNYDFYRGWARRNILTLTEGNVTDYDVIERELLEDQKNFRLMGVGYDPYGATQLVTHLLASKPPVPMVEVAQNVRQLSEPMKELNARIMAGKLVHNGDPVLSWAFANVQAKVDANENVYPRKSRPENKIDPAVAAIIAMNLMLRNVNVIRPSVYANAATAVI